MMRMVTLLTLWLIPLTLAQEPRAKPDQSKPLSPQEELATFKLHPNCTIELVAAEPQIVDPVAFCFDAKGDLYVVEMRGYPNGGIGDGQPNLPGRVKKLIDKDGDGYFETATIFLDNLRFPCALTPWRNGFLIGDAPDLFFAADTDGDGKADVRKVLYTGFGTKNIQQMINSLQFHFDNWVYGCNGGNDSPVRSVEKPDAPVVQLRGMHFRFKPDVPGSLEACSGGGQYGLTCTESGDWLTCTNSQHIRHIVLPHHCLKRNPHLAVPAVTHDIADHGAACKVFRISHFEQWRVERTTRRAGSDDAKRFPSTELVPGGYVTSASGICVWLPGEAAGNFHGHVFVCDPANNLIHRDVLVPNGSTYRAQRHDHDCEFLASTDTWFRPVFLANGPGGGLYVADFYREMVETPLSLPDDIKARWNLNSRERGRIWRMRTKPIYLPDRAAEPRRLKSLSTMSVVELAETLLCSRSSWEADTAQRLLLERRPDDEVVHRLVSMTSGRIRFGPESGRTRVYWLLQAWGKLEAAELRSPHFIPDLRLAEHLKLDPAMLAKELMQQVNDNYQPGHFQLIYSHNHLQLAMSVGSLPVLKSEDRVRILLALASHPQCDHWLEIAVLSSARDVELDLLRAALFDHHIRARFLQRLAAVVTKAVPLQQLQSDIEMQRFFGGTWMQRESAVLQGLGAQFVRQQPMLTKKILDHLKTSEDDDQRITRMALLALTSYQEAEQVLKFYLQPQQPPAVQLAALRALGQHADRRVAAVILEHWPGWGPQARREAQEVLFSRATFVEQMLQAAEQGKFSLRQLDSTRREQLARHPNAQLRARATRLLGSATARAEVLKKYQPALTLAGDVAKGKAHFTKHCAACHKFDGQGHEVGPDLHSALGNKTREALLLDLLDPNREVDNRYVNYVVTTTQGRTLTGMLSSESAQSVTLRRAEGVEETCLRSDIEELHGSGKSLMPENLEEQLTPQDVADVIAYLLAARSRK